MNKKMLLAALLAVCLTLTLCACGGEPAGPAEEPSTTAPTTTTTAAPAAPTAPTPADGEVLYTIKVVDADGNPKAGAYVQMCLESCVFKVSDVEGNVYFCMPEADYKVTLMNDGTAPAGYVAKEHHFESGSYEMTLVYDYAAENTAASQDNNEPYNDVEFEW